MDRLRAIARSQPPTEPCAGSNVSARSQSARNVSWTTSSATPRSDVDRRAAAKIESTYRSYRTASASDDPAATARTSATSSTGMTGSPAVGDAPEYVGSGRPVSAGPIGRLPAPRRAMGQAGQRPGRKVGLETGHAIRSDDRIVAGPGRQLEAIAGGERDAPSPVVGRPNRMVPTVATMTLSYSCSWARVPVAWPVRPGPGDQAFGPETCGGILGGHGAHARSSGGLDSTP